jgi:dephospho-CoA kinase
MTERRIRLRTLRQRADRPSARPCVVGVTGGIGCGKSTVCAILARHAVVLSADRVAREVMESDQAVQAAVRTLLGADAYLPDGRLDASFVASRVFADADALRRLNALTHPPTLRRLEVLIATEEAAGARLVIVESALIFEAGIRDRFDYVLAVTTSEETVIARLAGGDMDAATRLRARMQHQLPPEDKAARADFSIRNDGTVEELEQRTLFMLGVLMRLCRA